MRLSDVRRGNSFSAVIARFSVANCTVERMHTQYSNGKLNENNPHGIDIDNA